MAAAVAGLGAVSLALSACGGGGSGTAEGADAPSTNALKDAKGVTKVTFWHSMDGTNAEVLTKLVKMFNKEHQGDIKVEAAYVGKYDDAIAKYKASIQSESTPDVVQIYDIGTRFMIDAGQVVPMQSFIDRDKLDMSDLQPNIAGYYSVDDKLWSMPFNTSMPVLYYNKDLFTKAGLDPNDPPATLDEIRQDAEKLSKKNGGPAKYGFGAAIYGWFIEQFIAANGDLYCNKGNGRDGKATEVLFDQGSSVKVIQWWQKMLQDGLAANTGRETTAAQNAFKSGQVAMNLESTGTLGGYQEAAKASGFELGVANYPQLTKSKSGPIIGGASLWIDGKGHSDAKQEASWEFVKFLAEPHSQAIWHTGTGYFPISKGALNDPMDVKWRKKYPQFDVAVKQLENTELTKATQGCLLGVMPQARKAAEDGLEKALNGADVQKAMSQAADSVKPAIEQYNQSTE
jgi:sn-glycerol 3-phosphate transport system substrate-binding protein